jgi:RNA 3'-phosphate cyclase
VIEIDGSYGEAGGQILRTALALSCLLGKPFRIFNIRKGRSKQGLMPQHLACVRALATISGASVRGDAVSSTELIFVPGKTKPGDYEFDIGTAGSTSLLLQAILPALAFAGKRSALTLKGGTHVPFSPPFHYISEVFIPTLRTIGINADTSVKSYGFYPKGGGEIKVKVFPPGQVRPVNLTYRGDINRIKGISGVVNLPTGIAERQRNACLEALSPHGIHAEITLLAAEASGKAHSCSWKQSLQSARPGSPPSEKGEKGRRRLEKRRRKNFSIIITPGPASITTSPTRSCSTSPLPGPPRRLRHRA